MNPAKASTYLDSAAAIAARLCRDALWDGRRCNWLGASMEPVGGRWTLVQRTFGPEIYAGTSGIAYFLSRLYRLTGDAIVARTAAGAARQALSRRDDLLPNVRLGFYAGQTGLAYALVDLGEALGDEDWIRTGIELARSLATVDLTRHILDVLAGTAGAIPALLSLHRRHPDGALLDLAVRLGEDLVAKARRRNEGWSWNTLVDSPELQRDDMLGFSHGAGGIAWALLELYRVTSDARFRTAAEEGFRYERHWYDAGQENWPDMREHPELAPAPTGGRDGAAAPLFYPLQWCHGAPGLGLARLRAFEILGDPLYRAEAEAALRSTYRGLFDPGSPLPPNYSLCHGRAGNAELFLYASRVLGIAPLRLVADQVGESGLAAHGGDGTPWPSGVSGGAETPNLMLGSAGTGYFYLRLHDPEATPPIVIVLPD
jgi:lantibiotic modifying enzyme